MINWNNMDTLASYQALQEAKKVNLAQEMRGENGAAAVIVLASRKKRNVR